MSQQRAPGAVGGGRAAPPLLRCLSVGARCHGVRALALGPAKSYLSTDGTPRVDRQALSLALACPCVPRIRVSNNSRLSAVRVGMHLWYLELPTATHSHATPTTTELVVKAGPPRRVAQHIIHRARACSREQPEVATGALTPGPASRCRG